MNYSAEFKESIIRRMLPPNNDMGVICGVTTNPFLIAKEGRIFEQVIAENASIVDGPISGEVKATTTDAEGIKTNVTLIFSANQALLAARAGADIATVPYNVIEQMTHHPLTDIGIEKFKKDYIAVFGE